ncbi:hypothetical protein SAMN05421821_11639 [Mucilaginibacter lappiensis]|uniref:DUF1223 domain-containing protein n=1 Tax=Mucilaginibacter lappiensis TaxID=354630 RepID=A0ABR6PV01_9SPHI|nr:DUF1223 domain-containing protein [Mucilaginibacter lappiensis]MBB6112141.1 hypothetical protein [Mucilaginibacter lappiensis]SIR93844.1 hypothetical protein SAMN05421821_11639 [Mucilaginibacter lappiensis]
MKTLKILTFCAGAIASVLLTAALIDPSTASPKKDNPPVTGKGFALLELFTSEGCSSCPAADDLLAKIQKEFKDKPVYVLAYHVDYWNRLGWKDVFSNAEFSKRQVAYGQWLNNPQIYTPQVVINGKAEYIGSDETALRDAISGALAGTASANVALQVQQDKDKLAINYQVTGGSTTDNLLIALVQKSATSKVAAGENSGRTLAHAQIVRELQTVTLNADKKGTSHIKTPQGFNSQNWEVVGFIQNTSTGEVLSATRANLNSNINVKSSIL